MKFINEFEYPEDKKTNKQEFEQMAYNTFCVNFVNQVLKKELNFTQSINNNKILFSMEIPVFNKIKDIQKKIENSDRILSKDEVPEPIKPIDGGSKNV